MSTAHLIAAGETVAIFRRDPCGSLYLEGYATVEGPALNEHYYRIRFVGDPVVRERFVSPRAERDPERVLAVLVDVWLHRNEGALDWSDFWPELA